MQLLREVDFKQTRCNARDVLKNFRRLERMAGRSLIDIKSPIITDMPKAPKHGNKAEDAIIQMMDIEAERDAILAALMSLGITSRQVLYYRYCAPDGYSNYKIGREIGYSERSVERLMSEALIEFAEAYKKGRLIAYR
ncbi:ArpU family phage packaging/lysis transcriptional regulator [Enterococcus lactis]|uniref:ArpU family phage packaging/lysis transcriptional regulator n=1 Tax=Enterococcus lactis TaxID=357441 RepID=UPI0019F40640|nr:ArpU family phage packaging/lysis transcriptional regulator [Enterococcus lactis]EGP4701857.1 autolysin [Enterococcus faecium]